MESRPECRLSNLPSVARPRTGDSEVIVSGWPRFAGHFSQKPTICVFLPLSCVLNRGHHCTPVSRDPLSSVRGDCRMTYPNEPDETQRLVVDTPPADIDSDLGSTTQVPVKVCPRCSVQSQTAGSFCPHCAASYMGGTGPRSKISRRIVIAAVAALVVVGSATGLAVKVSHDNEVTSQRVAAAHALKLETDAAKVRPTPRLLLRPRNRQRTTRHGLNDRRMSPIWRRPSSRTPRSA